MNNTIWETAERDLWAAIQAIKQFEQTWTTLFEEENDKLQKQLEVNNDIQQ